MANRAAPDGALQRYRICPVDEVPEGGGVMVDLGGREVGVFKHQGRLHAYDNRCLHQGGPVCSGEVLGVTRLELDAGGEVVREYLDDSERRLICPWHGWEYDLTSGELAHDRRFRLRRFEVTVEDGIVYVDA
ncbi:MAG TPA: Rieske (2Fe-2S) protein [Capillimicrobium sp.]|nr:Rieske (2Fe-2S) protein [Capillimicrobium sp.]